MRGPATPATLAVGFVGFPLGVEAGAAEAEAFINCSLDAAKAALRRAADRWRAQRLFAVRVVAERQLSMLQQVWQQQVCTASPTQAAMCIIQCDAGRLAVYHPSVTFSARPRSGWTAHHQAVTQAE